MTRTPGRDFLLNQRRENQIDRNGWKRLAIFMETTIILLYMADILPNIAEARTRTAGQRIKRRRQELGLSQTQLARTADLTQGFLSALETGRRQLAPKTLERLAQALDLPSAVIVGHGSAHDSPQPYEATPLPLFGSIPAGPPSQTQEQAETWPVLKHLWSPDYYCLRLAFDSMEPTLKPGDIVLVHYRADVNPLHVQGKICACLIDGLPTLKRLSVEKRNGRPTIVLRGDNPDVSPLSIDPSQDFSVQGIVVRLVSRDL